MPTYGEIFTNQQANQNYGPALESVPISADTFRTWLNQTNNCIMFKIINGNIIVLDNNRKIIYSQTDSNINPEDVCIMYSVSVINDLLNLGGEANINVNIEQRNSVLTVTFGDHTMETGILCPPNCPHIEEEH